MPQNIIVAYGKGVRTINRSMVVSAIKDTNGLAQVTPAFLSRYFYEFALAMVAAVVVLVVLGVLR